MTFEQIIDLTLHEFICFCFNVFMVLWIVINIIQKKASLYVGGFCYIILNLNLSNMRPTGFFLHRLSNIANIKLHFFFFLEANLQTNI